MSTQPSNVRRSLVAVCLAQSLPWASAAFTSAGQAQTQGWPIKPLRLVVPFAPGGATDAIARIVSEQLAARLGQAVVIENKPGASTIVGVDGVVKAAPDGTTLLMAGVGSFSVLPALRRKLPFEVEKDLALLALLAYTPNILVTAADKPYRSLADLVAAAKAKPRSLRYGTYGDGSAPHLAGALLESAAQVDMEAIPYKGSADVKLALLRGDVDLGFDTLSSLGGDLKGGRLRALAHGGTGRSALLPDLPGLQELGYGQAAVQPYYGMAAPAGVPLAVRERLTKELLAIMVLPEVREKCAAAFLEPVSMGPAEMAATVQRDTAAFRRVAQRLNLIQD